MSQQSSPGAGFLSVWGGGEEPHFAHVTQMPVVHSVSFGYDDVDHWEAVALDEVEGDVYSRNTNPTVATFEEKVRTSRSRRNHRCVPGDEQSRRVHRRGTGGHGHPGEPNSLLGRD